MQIQQDSPYAHDENPAALLASAEIEAAGLHRSFKIIRLWNQSSARPQSQPRRNQMIEEERRLASLYAATIFEIGSAFGIEKANELTARIEASCILHDWEYPPAEQGLLFPIPDESPTATSAAKARK
jgi:hypothetical protein